MFNQDPQVFDAHVDDNTVCAGCGTTNRTLRWHCSSCGGDWCMHCSGGRLRSFNREDPGNEVPCPGCGRPTYPCI